MLVVAGEIDFISINRNKLREDLGNTCRVRRGSFHGRLHQPLKIVTTLFVYHVVIRSGLLAPEIVLEVYNT